MVLSGRTGFNNTNKRIVLNKMSILLKDFTDPLHFCYKRNIYVDDVVIYVVQRVYSHLEVASSNFRFVFYFPSAFNTIHPHIRARKLLDMNVPYSYVSWIFRYLTNRCQYVRREGIRSPTEHLRTPGTVLAPFLYTLYTSDYKSTDNVYPLIKYLDVSVIVGLDNNNDDSGYLREINDFVKKIAVKCHED